MHFFLDQTIYIEVAMNDFVGRKKKVKHILHEQFMLPYIMGGVIL